MSEQDLKNKKKITDLGRIIRISFYIVTLTILLIASIFGFVILNKESRFSQWVVDSSFLGNYIKLNNNALKEQKKSEPQLANNLLGLNPSGSDIYQFSPSEKSMPVVEVINKVLPSVLSITVSPLGNNSLQEGKAAGTGYIIDSKGLVITNKHVISQACSGQEISIVGVNSKDKSYTLELLSVDPIDDIAILKINDKSETEFPALTFADSNLVKLGTEVVAIGNALGSLSNTVTKGIVSGLNREIPISTQQIIDECTGSQTIPEGLIQTDAAINKGNSGGPLFNSSGLIIGMNTYGTGGENIGLAIPSTRILSALNSFQKNGKIIRPRLGVSSQTITDSLKKRNPWLPSSTGEIIYNNGQNPIVKDSAAEKSGLKEGDIILAVNGTKLEKNESEIPPLKRVLQNFQSGDTIELTVIKSTEKTQNKFNYTGKEEKISVQLGGQSFDIPRRL
jgi:S1-C subfamily serine protease